MSCETMTRNPCRLCAHHLSGGDKSAACCMECKDRVAYVRAIGGMYGGMPDHMTDLCRPRAGVNKEDIVENIVESVKTEEPGENVERKCRKCGVPKPIKQFRHNKECSGGREWTCRACRKIKDDERIAAKKLAAAEAAKATKPKKRAKRKSDEQVTTIPAAMTPAEVEPIEPAEIGIPIEEETPAQPEPATSPNNLKIINTLDERCFQEFLESKNGEEAIISSIRSAEASRNEKEHELLQFRERREAVMAAWDEAADSDAPPLRSQVSSLSPLSVQVGGDHYKHFAIQPIEFSTRNRLGFIEGCVIKRICRYNKPGGKGLQDLLKIKHEIDCLIAIDAKEKMEATS